jgi:hypothetical protein
VVTVGPAVASNGVMAGLVPAIHVFLGCSPTRCKAVDARHKAGHDGVFAEMQAR